MKKIKNGRVEDSFTRWRGFGMTKTSQAVEKQFTNTGITIPMPNGGEKDGQKTIDYFGPNSYLCFQQPTSYPVVDSAGNEIRSMVSPPFWRRLPSQDFFEYLKGI